MKLYGYKEIENLINRYIKKGGEMYEIKEGTLGYGELLLYGEGLKTIVVKEVYINSWSSGHSIRRYNKIPKKYELSLVC